MNTKRKAVAGAIRNGNPLNKTINVPNNPTATNSSKNRSTNQRICACGTIIPRDAVIFVNTRTCADCQKAQSDLEFEILSVVTTPRRVFKCIPCRSCQKPFLPQKLVTNLMICRDCLRTAQTETPAKRSRIIAEVVKNYTMALQRQVFAGGMR